MFVNEWKDLDDHYKSFSHPSKAALLSHLNPSSAYNEIAHLHSIDIDYLKKPVTQNTIDIWHLSGKTAHEFSTDSLCNIQQHSESIYCAFTAHLTQFTRLFYSSLPLYLANTPDLLLGDVNNLLTTILQIMFELKNANVQPNGTSNIHIDLECKYKYSTKLRPNDDDKQNESEQDEEDDAIYTYNRAKDIHSNKHQASKPKPRPKPKKRQISRGTTYDLVRELMNAINKPYHHYVLALDGHRRTDELTSYELASTIPRSCIEYSPLCKLYNTINRMKYNYNHSVDDDEGLLTFSFHKYSDRICLYALFCDPSGHIHGSRIFTNELITVLPKLFDDPAITNETLAAFSKIPSTWSKDKDYKKFADFLKVESSSNDTVSKILDFACWYNAKWNQDIELFRDEDISNVLLHGQQLKERPTEINGYAVMQRILNDDNIDIADFNDLYDNLAPYGLRKGPVRKLWKILNPNNFEEPVEDEEFKVIAPVGSYMYIPSDFTESFNAYQQQLLFEDDIDTNDNDEILGENDADCYVGSYIYIPSVHAHILSLDEFMISNGLEDDNEDEIESDIELAYGESLSLPDNY